MESSRRNEPAYARTDEWTLVSRSRSVSDGSLLGFLRGRRAPRAVWTRPDGPGIAGVGAAAMLSAGGSGRFAEIREAATDLFADHDESGVPHAARPRLLGGFAFDEMHDARAPWDGFPAAWFVLPKIQLVADDGDRWLTVSAYGPDVDPAAVEARLDDVVADLASDAGPTDDPPRVVTTSETTREAWIRQVSTAVERIRAGRLSKVALAGTLTATLDGPLSVPDLLSRLEEPYPDCYRFLVEPTAGTSFFGATPERLVSLSGREVETEALAGSIARGDGPEEDDALAERLSTSEKVREEHALVADMIGERLSSLGADVTVEARELARLANVQHLRTPITADLSGDAHVLSVVEALHPTPAVGGLPQTAAMETIRALESFDRGWYAAPVGWFDADGDGTFSVGIRSGLKTAGSVTLFAGNGIVADSDPAEEWEEVRLKYRPILDALEGR